MQSIDLEFVRELYAKYRDSLAAVRDEQRAYCQRNQSTMTPQLDDLEAEVTYLLVREFRPEVAVELGTFYGWSTTWLLSAIRDNGSGHLCSFDITDNVLANVPDELSKGRWSFRQGDIRQNVEAIPDGVDYLFVDAAHNGRFARWYLDHVFPKVPAQTPVSVHDVFHGKRAWPFTEGAVVLKWLADRSAEFFTPSRARSPHAYRALHDIKREHGLDEPVRTSTDNPMIFFTMPN